MIGCFRGMSPAAAELMYIKLAQQLPEYGHEIYQALVRTCIWNVYYHDINYCLFCFVCFRTEHSWK